MAAELVARAGEVDRLRTDLEAVQAESQNLRSEVAQLSKTADETQKRLNAEVGTVIPMSGHSMCVISHHAKMPFMHVHQLSGLSSV